MIWDWTDRSPGVVRITGQFVAPGTGLGPAYPTGLAMSNDAFPGPPLLLTWNYGASRPDHRRARRDPADYRRRPHRNVELISDVSGVSANQSVQYRITLQGFTLDFTCGDEIDLAVYATATEHIRPGEWSA